MHQTSNRCNHGFTILEVLIVVLFIGILCAIALPSWLAFLNRLRLSDAQDQVYQAMREAQGNAKRDKVTWQVSFQKVSINGDNVIQWVVHPATAILTNTNWHNLSPNIHLDDETTLQKLAGISRVQFDYRGDVVLNPSQNLGLGRVTLSMQDGSSTKRCVYVSTFLGAIRSAQEHQYPKIEGNKISYCY